MSEDLVNNVPPHSIEAEQSVLGSVLMWNDCFEDVLEKLSEQDFYRIEHKIIFRAMLTLKSQNTNIDILTLEDFLSKLGKLEEIGGLSYIGALGKNTPTAANVLSYAEIVRNRSVLRRLLKVGIEITRSALNPGLKTSDELLDFAERMVFSVSDASEDKNKGPQPIAEVLAKTVNKIDEIFNNPGRIKGLTTGFIDLDQQTTGLQDGDLIVVAGRPSMGKTAFALNIAEQAAITSENGAVLFFSMEMPAEQIGMRFVSSMSRVEMQKIRTGQIEDIDWTRITSGISMLASKKLLIDDSANLTTFEIRARARRVAREHKLRLVIVDYLQLIRVDGHYDNRANQVAEISRSLKALAKELNVPVIALSQLSRNLESRTDKRPIMSDLRESGAIEQDADLILFVYRDEVYHKDSNDKGTAEILIRKQRNGPIGEVRLVFLGQYSKFENYHSESRLQVVR